MDVAPTPVVDKIKGDDEQRARDLRSAAIYVAKCARSPARLAKPTYG